MRNTWLIAFRELRERAGSRSFIVLSLIGPLLVLGMLYMLFALGGESKKEWNVLIADPAGIMGNKILSNEDKSIHYSFADGYIETEEFFKAKRFQQFDALLEVNEKVLSNKTSFVFYREKPSTAIQIQLKFHFERRLEELMIDQFTDLSVADFRIIKQPITVAFRNVEDPLNETEDLKGWVGLCYGTIIFVFIFLFGMTVLRSVSREKSNRIVEVLLGSVNPRQLLLGKITGIGLAAFIQFILWVVFIGLGLYLMREVLFPEMLDPTNFNFSQMTEEVKNLTLKEQMLNNQEYNEFVDLIYQRIQFGTMTFYFMLFFIVGYLFYGAFFAAIGAAGGSENDGQQFVLPVIFLLLFSLYGGYYTLQNPESYWTTILHYLPFTSPVVVMVKLAQGYPPNQGYELFLSLVVLIISAALVLALAGRLYTNGILHYGHRLRLKTVVKWLKNS
jgi:ABC-2 type transport system permease protein